jgi:hypothetical protein
MTEVKDKITSFLMPDPDGKIRWGWELDMSDHSRVRIYRYDAVTQSRKSGSLLAPPDVASAIIKILNEKSRGVLRDDQKIIEQIESRIKELDQQYIDEAMRRSCESCRYFVANPYYHDRRCPDEKPYCSNSLVMGLEEVTPSTALKTQDTSLCGPEKALWETAPIGTRIRLIARKVVVWISLLFKLNVTFRDPICGKPVVPRKYRGGGMLI